MQPFNVRNDLSHDDALDHAACALEQALGIVDSIEDDIEDDPKLQARVFAVESILEAAQELVYHAICHKPAAEVAA